MKIFKPFEHTRVKDLTDVLVNRGDNVTHGDLIIVKCGPQDLPLNYNDLVAQPIGVLAEGEHTQHAHQLFYDNAPTVEAYKPKKGFTPTVYQGGENKTPFTLKKVSEQEMYLVIEETLLLKHQEHVPFRLPPGMYEIGIQQEYDPYERMKRSVVD